jgi:hypothetical protein
MPNLVTYVAPDEPTVIRVAHSSLKTEFNNSLEETTSKSGLVLAMERRYFLLFIPLIEMRRYFYE